MHFDVFLAQQWQLFEEKNDQTTFRNKEGVVIIKAKKLRFPTDGNPSPIVFEVKAIKE